MNSKYNGIPAPLKFKSDLLEQIEINSLSIGIPQHGHNLSFSLSFSDSANLFANY